MRNRTITALLIAFAVAGVEAQTYQSALRLIQGEITIEDIIAQSAKNAIKEDLLSTLKFLQQQEDIQWQHPSPQDVQAVVPLQAKSAPFSSILPIEKASHSAHIPHPAIGRGIFIRAPSFYII